MAEHEWLAERFEENRGHLRAVACRMLGSLSEADDAIQETWIRLSRSDASGIENLGGWLTTVVARVCLDMLRSRTSRREQPMGEDVPEPIANSAGGIDLEQKALLADSVGIALLVVLDRLNLFRSCTVRTTSARGWGGGSRVGSAWRTAQGALLHVYAWEDRPNRRGRRPCAPSGV